LSGLLCTSKVRGMSVAIIVEQVDIALGPDLAQVPVRMTEEGW